MKRSPKDLELSIGLFLRYGVLFSGLLILVGWLASVDLASGSFAGLKEFEPVYLSAYLRQESAAGRWGNLLSLSGILVLLLLPVVRVFLTGVLFFSQRENILGAISLFVLAALIFSFSLGIR